MKEAFSKIPTNTFQQLGINAAMILSAFDPFNGTYNNADIIGATTGGINFTATPEFQDWGEDIDNCPKNTKEMKRITDWTVTASGNFVTINAEMAERLAVAADNTSTNKQRYGRITPRDTVDIEKDFRDIWIVGDYSDKNNGTFPGYIAVHMMNTLNTGGFQIQTGDKEKMQFAFEFTAHYSNDAQDTVPFEIYIHSGTTQSSVRLSVDKATIKVGDTLELSAFVGGSTAYVIDYEANDTTTTTSGAVTLSKNSSSTAVYEDSVTVTGAEEGVTLVSAQLHGTTAAPAVCIVTVYDIT